MYIKIGEAQYPCVDYGASPGVTASFIGVDGLTLPVSGEVSLYADGGFELAVQDAATYARQTYENSMLTLTNEPEPAQNPEPMPPSPLEQLRADIDYLAVMMEVEL